MRLAYSLRRHRKSKEGQRVRRSQIITELESGNEKEQGKDRTGQDHPAQIKEWFRGAVNDRFGLHDNFRSLRRIEVRFDRGKSAAALRINLQAFTRNGEEWFGNGERYYRFSTLRSVPGGRLLGESFDQKDAKRPDVGRRGEMIGFCFRCIVDAGPARAPTEVRRELEMVTDNHDVGGPEVTMRETATVKIREGIQNGTEHLPGFVGRERPLGENLGEGFVGVLGDDIEQIYTLDVNARSVKKRHQVRMGESPGDFPLSDGSSCVYRFEGEDFNGGFFRWAIIEVG